eukprot:scaffold60202_cov23-Tisochrysis_lutea.AAC.3
MGMPFGQNQGIDIASMDRKSLCIVHYAFSVNIWAKKVCPCAEFSARICSSALTHASSRALACAHAIANRQVCEHACCRGRSRNPSPQRAMKQHTHLSDFSMPVKLREMGPAHAASNTKTGTSPPSKQQWQQQQQQQHLPPQVHHYQQQQQELLWGSAMQSAAAAQQQEQHSVHGASPQPQQVPPQTQAKMPVPGPSAA